MHPPSPPPLHSLASGVPPTRCCEYAPAGALCSGMAWVGSLSGLPTYEDGRINVSLISQSKRIELLAERGEKATGFPAEDEAKLQRVRGRGAR